MIVFLRLGLARHATFCAAHKNEYPDGLRNSSRFHGHNALRLVRARYRALSSNWTTIYSSSKKSFRFIDRCVNIAVGTHEEINCNIDVFNDASSRYIKSTEKLDFVAFSCTARLSYTEIVVNLAILKHNIMIVICNSKDVLYVIVARNIAGYSIVFTVSVSSV